MLLGYWESLSTRSILAIQVHDPVVTNSELRPVQLQICNLHRE